MDTDRRDREMLNYCCACEDADPDDDLDPSHEFATLDGLIDYRVRKSVRKQDPYCVCGHTRGSHTAGDDR